MLSHFAGLFYFNYHFYVRNEDCSPACIAVGSEKFDQDGQDAAGDEFYQGKVLWKRREDLRRTVRTVQEGALSAACGPDSISFAVDFADGGYRCDQPSRGAYLSRKSGVLDAMLGSLDLSSIPAEVGGIAYLIPLIAALSAWFMCFIQNRINVLQSEQGKVNQLGTIILSIGLSLYLGFFVKTGVGIYWTFSNLFSVLQLYFLNIIMNPRKYIDYEALEKSRAELKAASAFGRQGKKKLFEKNPYKKKEKADYKRFFQDYEMQLVFYSEKNGFYKYFQNIIETLLEKSDVVVNYITSDPNDKVFEMASDRFRPYYIGENKLIVLMMKMEADIVVMTTPDLESFHIKRSLVRKDNEYIYVPHDVNSPNLTFRKEALDHFDTIFSSGCLCTKEIRKREELYKLPEKRIVEWGSGVIDNMIQSYEEMDKKGKENKRNSDRSILAEGQYPVIMHRDNS